MDDPERLHGCAAVTRPVRTWCFVLRDGDGIETIALEIGGDHIVAIYAIRNPDELRNLS